MKRASRFIALLASLGAPTFAAAQTGINTAYIKTYSDSIIYIINNILVPTLIALAFIVFLYGVYRYFIQGAASDADRATGRQFALWGVIGFVIIVSLWGIVNLFTSTLGLTASNVPGFPVFSTGTYVPPSGAPAGTYVLGGGGNGGCVGNFKPNPAVPGQCIPNSGGGSTLGSGGGMTAAQSAALTSLNTQYNSCLSSGSAYSAVCTAYQTALDTYNAAFSSTVDNAHPDGTFCQTTSADGYAIDGTWQNGTCVEGVSGTAHPDGTSCQTTSVDGYAVDGTWQNGECI